MRGLDYLMRRKGWFLVFLAMFAAGGFLGYQAITTWKQHQAEQAQTEEVETPTEPAQPRTDEAISATDAAASDIEVPHTGGDYQKRPDDGILSDYSGGRTTVSDTLAQVGTFPFDFGRDLKPGMSASAVAAADAPTEVREVVRTVAKVAFGSSVLALALHFLSDRYLR